MNNRSNSNSQNYGGFISYKKSPTYKVNRAAQQEAQKANANNNNKSLSQQSNK